MGVYNIQIYYGFNYIKFSFNSMYMRHMTHIIDVLTPFASSDGFALGSVRFAIP